MQLDLIIEDIWNMNKTLKDSVIPNWPLSTFQSTFGGLLLIFQFATLVFPRHLGASRKQGGQLTWCIFIVASGTDEVKHTHQTACIWYIPKSVQSLKFLIEFLKQFHMPLPCMHDLLQKRVRWLLFLIWFMR